MKSTNRIPARKRYWPFYIAGKVPPGTGLQDRYGRVYMTQRDGSLKLVKDKERELEFRRAV
jgi:hypothetical protein